MPLGATVSIVSRLFFPRRGRADAYSLVYFIFAVAAPPALRIAVNDEKEANHREPAPTGLHVP